MTVNGANSETNRRLQRLEDGQAETNRRLDKLEVGQAETNRRLDQLETGQEELRAGQGELRAGQEELRTTVARIERNIQAIRDDIGPLKASHARNGARGSKIRICNALGLRLLGELSQRELADILYLTDTSDITSNELDSFLRADLFIKAEDPDGGTHYIAVEASFTADERDTRRAIRNAEFLTRFTGMPTHAVIAGRRIDNRIHPIIERGLAGRLAVGFVPPVAVGRS